MQATHNNSSPWIVFIIISTLCLFLIGVSGTSAQYVVDLEAPGRLDAWGYVGSFVLNPPPGSDFIDLSVTWTNNVALRSDGSVATWGMGTSVSPPSGKEHVAVAAGRFHSLAIKSDGSIVCWGHNELGQCDLPDRNDYVAIEAGEKYSLALLSNGSLVGAGQIYTNHQFVPVPVPAGYDFVAISAGLNHHLAIRSDGTIVASGNTAGQGAAPTGSDYIAISAGPSANLALHADGTLEGWGFYDNGYSQVPMSAPGGSGYVAIDAGINHFLALKADGSIVGWGRNTDGQADVPAGNDYVDIAAGYAHTVVIEMEPWMGDDFRFDDGTAQEWVVVGAFDEFAGGPYLSDFTSGWSDAFDDPTWPGVDPTGDGIGSIGLETTGGHGVSNPGASFWGMQYRSPNLSRSTLWQQATGATMQLGEGMGIGVSLSGQMVVRVYDIDQGFDRWFTTTVGGEPGPRILNHDEWNAFVLEWSTMQGFPANYIVRELLVNVWGYMSDGPGLAGGVYLDDVLIMYPDGDGDGWSALDDCDDTDPGVYPGAQEICDGKDSDCDPSTPDGFDEPWLGAACDGPDAGVCLEGIFSCAAGVQLCSDATGDDLEICDGLDNDCDGIADNGLDYDTDGDGHNSLGSCNNPEDCDDNNPLIWDCNTPVRPFPITFSDGPHTVTLPNVTSGGNTSVTASQCDLGQLDGLALAYPDSPCLDVQTDAGFDPPAEVCMAYDLSVIECPGTGLGGALVMISCDGQGKCEALTRTNPGICDGTVCALTDHFSIFAFGTLLDGDGDGVPDLLDNCPDDPNGIQKDSDGDEHGDICDCAPGVPATHPGAVEVNDGQDNQCPGDDGYGAIDEISGECGFHSPADPSDFTWSAQSGATLYEVVRSIRPDFSSGCTRYTTSDTRVIDPEPLPNGGVAHYVVRALSPNVGSWGHDSAGLERQVPCLGATRSIFTFQDTSGDDLPMTAVADFFSAAPTSPADFLLFEIETSLGTYSLCTERADFYRDSYLAYAPSGFIAQSGPWARYYRSPMTGSFWAGPDYGIYTNLFGTSCNGTPYAWCPDRNLGNLYLTVSPTSSGPCEAYDAVAGGCGNGNWRLTIGIAETLTAACGL